MLFVDRVALLENVLILIVILLTLWKSKMTKKLTWQEIKNLVS